ncbi:glycosyltransferase family 9 protein [Flavobacterium branchiarum]|uniref:Glycosyltransferase family 9 protein n=1 Tax=Flavobacterium branchiarum TaxID=1114870 RepID=A0ABV5FJH3_9FLAO|nr:glycosyltransferase family 9 protein [Flavobacterium branchiarum]MDN3674308.1 glycosyltransferase family 9 protein [Flavobacterium branchiarum]
MKFLKSINIVRRNLMHRLTKNIGYSKPSKKSNSIIKSDIKRVLISRPNARLGNLLLITPLLEEVINTFPGCKIDLFVKGSLAPILFENYDNVDKIIQLPKKPFNSLLQYVKVCISLRKQHYDIAINVDKNSSSGRLSVKFSNSKFKFFGDPTTEDIQLKYNDYEHIAKYPVYNFRSFLNEIGITPSNTPISALNLKLSNSEITEGKKTLENLIDNNKKTICIYTYATGDKCHSKSWWSKFYKRLKTKYPDYNIIEILPIENVSQINFKAPHFYSKDIREIGALIANTEVFIGADCGIMHLASAVQTPTVGLFSISEQKKYEPYCNHSMAINTNKTSIFQSIKIIAYMISHNLSLRVTTTSTIIAFS